jgi:hypothetical protein
MSKPITKFIVVFFLAGILGGAIFGIMLALLVLGIFYNPFIFGAASLIVSLFYIPGIWKILTKYKTYPVIIRKVFEVLLVSGFLTAMFSLEEGTISFGSFDWTIIYFCLGIVIIPLTLYLLLAEYFNQSRIYKEIEHIKNGMQLYGILPNENKKK